MNRFRKVSGLKSNSSSSMPWDEEIGNLSRADRPSHAHLDEAAREPTTAVTGFGKSQLTGRASRNPHVKYASLISDGMNSSLAGSIRKARGSNGSVTMALAKERDRARRGQRRLQTELDALKKQHESLRVAATQAKYSIQELEEQNRVKDRIVAQQNERIHRITERFSRE